MRKLLLATMAVVVVMGISRIATAEVLTANKLLDWCESGITSNKTLCLGYLAGFLQGIAVDSSVRKLGGQLCLPKHFSAAQLRKMFVKETNEMPENLHLQAAEFLYVHAAEPFLKPIAKGNCPD